MNNDFDVHDSGDPDFDPLPRPQDEQQLRRMSVESHAGLLRTIFVVGGSAWLAFNGIGLFLAAVNATSGLPDPVVTEPSVISTDERNAILVSQVAERLTRDAANVRFARSPWFKPSENVSAALQPSEVELSRLGNLAGSIAVSLGEPPVGLAVAQPTFDGPPGPAHDKAALLFATAEWAALQKESTRIRDSFGPDAPDDIQGLCSDIERVAEAQLSDLRPLLRNIIESQPTRTVTFALKTPFAAQDVVAVPLREATKPAGHRGKLGH